MSGRGFSHESARNESIEWYTPPEIFKALDYTFDMDPCSPGQEKSHVSARRHLTIEDDGLATPWEGTCWVNPPYGRHTGTWMKKLSEHNDGIALVFARTDVKWFTDYVADKASLICFVSGRIKFIQGSTGERAGSPGAGSMLVAYGEKAKYVLWQSGLGPCMTFVPPAIEKKDAA